MPQEIQDMIKGKYTSFLIAEELEKTGIEEKLPELIQLLNNKDPEVREKTTYVLGNIDWRRYPERIENILSEIIKLLKDKNRHVRAAAIHAIGIISLKFPEFRKELLPLIIEMLDDRAWIVRQEAIAVISYFDQDEELVMNAIPKLVELLNDDKVSITAAVALLKLASRSSEILEEILTEFEEQVKLSANQPEYLRVAEKAINELYVVLRSIIRD